MFCPKYGSYIKKTLQEHRGSQTTNQLCLWSYSCFGLMAMKTHEDRIVGMYPPGCTRYRYPMLDVLTRTLVWIGVAAMRLDYSRVDVAVWGVSEEKSALSMSQGAEDNFFRVTWNITTKVEAFPYVRLMRSMDCGIMSFLWACEDFMRCDHSVCESTSLMVWCRWNTFFYLSVYLSEVNFLEHTTSSYCKSRPIELDLFSINLLV